MMNSASELAPSNLSPERPFHRLLLLIMLEQSQRLTELKRRITEELGVTRWVQRDLNDV